jgi:hypothetical protein
VDLIMSLVPDLTKFYGEEILSSFVLVPSGLTVSPT